MAAYRLRFVVFNLEMNEGLESAYADGYDKDHFDDVCDHLIVEDKTTGAVVGTYRMQMGEVAGQYFGYYSEQEFCFARYESMRNQIVELGRACIHRDYRSSDVLHLLWRGIARYALVNGARYMMGCCSLTSQDPEMGHAVHESLRDCMVEPELPQSRLDDGCWKSGRPSISTSPGAGFLTTQPSCCRQLSVLAQSAPLEKLLSRVVPSAIPPSMA